MALDGPFGPIDTVEFNDWLATKAGGPGAFEYNGNLYYVFNVYGEVFKSTDGGYTWSSVIKLADVAEQTSSVRVAISDHAPEGHIYIGASYYKDNGWNQEFHLWDFDMGTDTLSEVAALSFVYPNATAGSAPNLLQGYQYNTTTGDHWVAFGGWSAPGSASYLNEIWLRRYTSSAWGDWIVATNWPGPFGTTGDYAKFHAVTIGSNNRLYFVYWVVTDEIGNQFQWTRVLNYCDPDTGLGTPLSVAAARTIPTFAKGIVISGSDVFFPVLETAEDGSYHVQVAHAEYPTPATITLTDLGSGSAAETAIGIVCNAPRVLWLEYSNYGDNVLDRIYSAQYSGSTWGSPVKEYDAQEDPEAWFPPDEGQYLQNLAPPVSLTTGWSVTCSMNYINPGDGYEYVPGFHFIGACAPSLVGSSQGRSIVRARIRYSFYYTDTGPPWRCPGDDSPHPTGPTGATGYTDTGPPPLPTGW